MMQQENFLKLFAKMCVAFSKEYSPEQCDIYYDELKHLTIEEVSLAMKRCVRTCRFFPNVADILESIPKHYHKHQKQLEASRSIPMPKEVKDMIGKIGKRI